MSECLGLSPASMCCPIFLLSVRVGREQMIVEVGAPATYVGDLDWNESPDGNSASLPFNNNKSGKCKNRLREQ